MQVLFKYFGQIAERLGKEEERISVPAATLNIRDFIQTQYPELRGFNFSVAINQEIRDLSFDNEIIQEVALFPPFAGG